MSRSWRFTAVPSLTIPEDKREMKDLALYLVDMVEIIETQETAIDQMTCNTRPGPLWGQLARAIDGFYQSLILPLEEEIEKQAPSDRNVRITGKGTAADRFLDATVVTYHLIHRLFKESAAKLSIKLIQWRRTYPEIITLLGTKEVYTRSTSEIVMEALLLANRDWPNADSDSHSSWLSSLVDSKISGHGPGLLNGAEPIRSPEFKERHQYRGRHSTLSYGSVACSCAAWNGRMLLTGTTLLKLGSLEELLLGHKRETVQTWFRKLRQSRFDPGEQQFLDYIIQPAMTSYHAEVKALLGGHEIATIRDRKKQPVEAKVDTPGLSHKEKRSLEHKALQESVELRKQLKGYIPNAQKTALERLIPRGHQYVPNAAAAVWKDKSVLGMAYEGSSYELKRKCPVCEAIYQFPVASPESLAKLKEEWERVGEADPARNKQSRGCCAEALVAVLLVVDRGAFNKAMHQLWETKKHNLNANTYPN